VHSCSFFNACDITITNSLRVVFTGAHRSAQNSAHEKIPCLSPGMLDRPRRRRLLSPFRLRCQELRLRLRKRWLLAARTPERDHSHPGWPRGSLSLSTWKCTKIIFAKEVIHLIGCITYQKVSSYHTVQLGPQYSQINNILRKAERVANKC